jgi:DNA-binding transcriptional MocR family regulator
VGWVYAGKFSEHIQHLQLMSTISVNSFIQNALVDYLSHRHYEKHLKGLRTTLKRLKTQYYQYLSKNLPEKCSVHYYPSGYFLWVTLPDDVESSCIYESMIQNNIGIAPSLLFYRKNKHQNHIRINCSFTMNETIIQALDLLIEQILVTQHDLHP